MGRGWREWRDRVSGDGGGGDGVEMWGSVSVSVLVPVSGLGVCEE